MGAIVFFLFFFKLLDFVWDISRLPLMEDWPVPPVAVISFLIAAGTALVVRRNEKANLFLNEVAGELNKVTWPARKETVLSTGVVIVMVGICSLILFMFDFLWGTITGGMLGF